MVGDFDFEDFYRGNKANNNDDKENVLIQFWEASSIKMIEHGRIYRVLTIGNKPFNIIYDAADGKDGELSSYRKESECRCIVILDDDYEENVLEGDRLQIVIRRVFRNKRPEIDFAKSRGIRSSLYIPICQDVADNYCCGVMEYVSTREEYLEKFRLYLGLNFFVGQKEKMYMDGDHLYGFGRLNHFVHAGPQQQGCSTVQQIATSAQQNRNQLCV